MQIYLMRHAIAEERSGATWPDDKARPLSADGLERMQMEVRGIARLGLGFDLVLSSPLVRARQTADILIEGLKRSGPLEVTLALAPGGGTKKTLAAIPTKGTHERVLLVGHDPDMTELMGDLLGSPVPVVFKKGGLCRIDFQGHPRAGAGILVFHLMPRILRLLGA